MYELEAPVSIKAITVLVPVLLFTVSGSRGFILKNIWSRPMELLFSHRQKRPLVKLMNISIGNEESEKR